MEISIDDLLALYKPNIIDIRSIQKYNDNHIPGAINISYDLLINNPSKYLDKDTVYYLYCQKGVTSVIACQLLKHLGYKVVSVIGGYEAYILKNF